MRRVERGAFLAPSLSSSFEKQDLAKPDKAFITDICYGTLRNLQFLDACLEPRLKNPDKLPQAVRNSLRLASYELLIKETPKHAAINEWVEVSKKQHKKLSGLVNAVLRRVERLEGLSEAETFSVPNWLYDDWKKLFGDQASTVAQGMNEPEPFWVYAYKPEATASFDIDSVDYRAGPLAQTFAIRSDKALNHLEAFKKGYIGAQNPASTLPASLLAIQEGDSVLDLASGNGIKTAQLASLGARVTSVELNSKKVKRAEANLKRLGLNAKHYVHDLRTAPTLKPFDKVLLDAPCSGTGTLRGHPEIRLRLSQKDISDLASLQKTMLDVAWHLTRAGGTLIYAICALSSQESHGVVSSFLKTHHDAEVVPFETALDCHVTDFGTFILPVNGLDGFFIAKLQRQIP